MNLMYTAPTYTQPLSLVNDTKVPNIKTRHKIGMYLLEEEIFVFAHGGGCVGL